jgi:hypothetical protein
VIFHVKSLKLFWDIKYFYLQIFDKMLWCKEKSLNHIPFDENKTLQKEKSTAIFLKDK